MLNKSILYLIAGSGRQVLCPEASEFADYILIPFTI